MSNGDNLRKAKAEKNDEFYTRIEDIEKEVKHYRDHFKDKIVYCNCDDPMESNFYRYFFMNFEWLGLKKLITTHYSPDHPTYALILDGPDQKPRRVEMKCNGDFRSPECIEYLKEADIVCTNPPFSLFREYMAQLMEYKKDFLIIGNKNAVTYKEIFPLIMNDNIWCGITKPTDFKTPSGIMKNVNGLCWWYTNIDYPKKHKELILYKNYTPEDYPKYDNYDAINVDNTSNIPKDYFDIMGVPITYIEHHNPDQFSIIGITDRQDTYGYRTHKYTKEETPKFNDLNARATLKINNELKAVYVRILIKRK